MRAPCFGDIEKGVDGSLHGRWRLGGRHFAAFPFFFLMTLRLLVVCKRVRVVTLIPCGGERSGALDPEMLADEFESMIGTPSRMSSKTFFVNSSRFNMFRAGGMDGAERQGGELAHRLSLTLSYMIFLGTRGQRNRNPPPIHPRVK